jgi:predicted site-specific integrase-resolvase
LSSQNLKGKIKDLEKQVENLEKQLKAANEITEIGASKSRNEAKLEKLLMTNKIELFNLKNQSKLAAELYEKEIAALTNEVAILKVELNDNKANGNLFMRTKH